MRANLVAMLAAGRRLGAPLKKRRGQAMCRARRAPRRQALTM
jgi:hypothetical protein